MNAQKRPHILYAEDDEDSCYMLSLLLGYSGIDVSSARSIEEAVNEAKRRKFDAYLLESRFRDGRGVVLCRRLRELTPHVPVIFYSADGRAAEKKLGLAAGAGAYLVKPNIDMVAPTILEFVTSSATRVNNGHLMAL